MVQNFFKSNAFFLIGIALICGLVPIVFGNIAGFSRVFYAVADTDLALIGEALSLNSGIDQSFFHHPSLLSIYWLAIVFRALNAFNLVAISDLTSLAQHQNIIPYIQQLSEATRYAGVFILSLTALAWASLIHQIFCSRWLTFLLCLLFVVGQGFVLQTVVYRMEPMSVFFMLLSLNFFVFALNQPLTWKFLTASFFAGGTLYFAAVTKVIILIFFVGLGFSILIFRRFRVQASTSATQFPLHSKCIFGFCAVLFSFSIVEIATATFVYSPLSIIFYVVLLGALVAFAYYRFNSHVLGFLWIGFISFGFCFAAACLLTFSDDQNLDAVINFFDHSRKFAMNRVGANALSSNYIETFFHHFLINLKGKFYWNWLWDYPIQFLFIANLCACLALSVLNRSESYKVGLSLIVYLVFEGFCRLRWVDSFTYDFVSYYKIYTELPLILATGYSLNALLRGENKLKDIGLIFVSICILICTLSTLNSVSRIKDNRFAALSINQPKANICLYTQQTSPHLTELFARGHQNCDEAIRHLKIVP